MATVKKSTPAKKSPATAKSRGKTSAKASANTSAKTQPKSSAKPRPKPAAAKASEAFKRVAKPDAIDFRDRPFRPNVSITPKPTMFPERALPVKHQGDTNACTGFALSLVVEHLLRKSRRELDAQISAFMLYSMARRYDEFPGYKGDDGSSLRGALKGWFKHGACDLALFPGLNMPAATDQLDDWWLDAVKRPLGAYYRIDPRSLTDMHAALNEVGILLVSAGCHSGWDEGMTTQPLSRRPGNHEEIWQIPVRGGSALHAGHAFAIVGYNERGFIIQNSWGPEWGSYGLAVLTYDDWLQNAMDCWVAQLGVVTQEHRDISRSVTLRTAKDGAVSLAASKVLRNREISPFIVNIGNNGALSSSGAFRTTPDDVRAIVDVQLAAAREKWGLGANDPIDVCLYAHGGLVGEDGAAETAAQWIPRLYEARVFPVFLMWETDFISTVMNTIEDRIKGIPRTAGGFSSSLERWWNERLERMLAQPGTVIWGEMKQNAEAISAPRAGVPDEAQAGAVLLYKHFKKVVDAKKVRMHMVGHSAGAIVAAHLIDRLVKDGMGFESLSLMAPAVNLATFNQHLLPHLKDSKGVKRYQQFMLTDKAEEDDPSCGPYRRSLLYLVSESFEGGARTPILGMEKYFDAAALPKALVHRTPSAQFRSSKHGDFDGDGDVQKAVVKFIRA